MGSGEDRTKAKHSKHRPAQETPIYPDWTNSIPAYYGAGASPPFFPSTVASPTPHPYLWGTQHPLMPPYGTPVPYPALYPPGGVYGHPSMAMPLSQMQANEDSDAKAPEGKNKVSGKKLKRSSGDKAGDSTKEVSGSGNDGATQSAESGSDDDSSDASDENNNNELSASKKGSFDQMLADGAHAQNSAIKPNFQNSAPVNPVISVPATNLNIGMNLWNHSAGHGANKMQPNPSVVPTPVIGREGMMMEPWIPDERELKRQKRKQSNRESARRSRLRKQAECEELQNRVETLTKENHSLRDEMQRVSEECLKLTSENDLIKEKITVLYGPDAVPKFEIKRTVANIPANAN